MVKADHKCAKAIFEEMAKYYHHRYSSECDRCGKVFIVYTQEDDDPEYYTHVSVNCECGGSAYFELPVN